MSGHRRLAVCRALGLPTMPVIVRDILEAGCHLLSGALTAALDTGAILAARLSANVIWIALVAVAFFLRPALSSYAALAPVQMGMVFIPLLLRWRNSWKRTNANR